MNRLELLLDSGLVDRGDKTIFDTNTNLLWQQNPAASTYDWEGANRYCKKLRLAGHNDWRIPTIQELGSLLDDRFVYFTINSIFICRRQCHLYWSSTTIDCSSGGFLGGYRNNIWLMDFKAGVDVLQSFNEETYVDCCVRAVREVRE